MAQQRVKFESALIVAPLDLKDIGAEAYKAIVLPAGAEILQVNLEVSSGADTSVTASIGLDDDDDFFSAAIAVDSATRLNSSVVTSLKQKGFVTIKLSQAATKGEATLRVHFFYPSERVLEV